MYLNHENEYINDVTFPRVFSEYIAIFEHFHTIQYKMRTLHYDTAQYVLQPSGLCNINYI